MPVFWKDPVYSFVVLMGPVFWGVLWLIGTPLTFSLGQSGYFYLTVLLIYPLIEELFFRGTLQLYLEQKGFFKRSLFSINSANIVTSMIFSLMHLYSHNLLWSVLVFFPSIVFGWSITRYKTLLAPMILHVFYNAGYYILFN